ncbi:hypothetical protein GCM10009574_088240 [Streptomyces asiaticus]|uniref:Uncharacterized protein n=3 Tax=Streptomyces TaxID=1883 RepID=A0ABN1SM48_9ACTN
MATVTLAAGRSTVAFIRAVPDWFALDRTVGQVSALYAACEKDTLRAQLTGWLEGAGVPVLVVRGFGSQSYVQVVIERDWVARTACWSHVERILLTHDQVREYELPAAAGKAGDLRWAGFARRYGLDPGQPVQWEVEALDPIELQRLVLAAVDPYIDRAVLGDCIAAEQRRRLRAFTDGWPPTLRRTASEIGLVKAPGRNEPWDPKDVTGPTPSPTVFPTLCPTVITCTERVRVAGQGLFPGAEVTPTAPYSFSYLELEWNGGVVVRGRVRALVLLALGVVKVATADPQTVRNACKDLRHADLVETVGKTSRLGAGGRPVTRQLWNLTTAGLAAAASELGRPVKEMGAQRGRRRRRVPRTRWR